MLPQCVLAFLLLAMPFYAANSKEGALSSSDITTITRICRQVVGYPVANEYKIFSQLTPLLRSKLELEHLIVDCSSQHCSGSIRLRDDAQVLYRSVHVPPERSKIGPGDLTPDIEYKGNNRFVGVALVTHGKIVFSQGELPKWSKDRHLYR